MIYVNAVKIDKADQYFQDLYTQVIARLKEVSGSKEKFSVIFKVRKTDISPLKTTDGRYVNTTADKCISFHQQVFDPNLNRTIDWLYTTQPLIEKNGEIDVSKAKHGKWVFKQDKLTEIIQDQDLAFFLYHVDPAFGEKKDNKKYQLVDTRGEDQNHVEKKVPEVNLQFTLYHQDSPLRQSKVLKTVARAWGVENVDQKPRPSLLIELEKAVRISEQQRQSGNKMAKGIEGFLKDVKMGKATRIGALVQMAHDKKIIRVSTTQDRMGVFWVDNYGNMTDKIVELTPRNANAWKDILVDYLLSHENLVKVLKSDLQYDEKEEEQENEMPELDGDMQYFFDHFDEEEMKSKYRDVATKCGISPYGKPKKAVKQELLKYFKEKYNFDYMAETEV